MNEPHNPRTEQACVIVQQTGDGLFIDKVLEEEKIKAGDSFKPAQSLEEAMGPDAKVVSGGRLPYVMGNIKHPKSLTDRIRTMLDTVLGPVQLSKEVTTDADAGDFSSITLWQRWRLGIAKNK